MRGERPKRPSRSLIATARLVPAAVVAIYALVGHALPAWLIATGLARGDVDDTAYWSAKVGVHAGFLLASLAAIWALAFLRR
jgi:hypothetical protein